MWGEDVFVCGVGGGEGVVGDRKVGQRVCFWKRRRRREKKAGEESGSTVINMLKAKPVRLRH